LNSGSPGISRTIPAAFALRACESRHAPHRRIFGYENLPGTGTMFYIDLPVGQDIFTAKPSTEVDKERNDGV